MIKVSVLYADKPGASFGMSYYLNTHIPMVRSKLGASAPTLFEIAYKLSDHSPERLAYRLEREKPPSSTANRGMIRWAAAVEVAAFEGTGLAARQLLALRRCESNLMPA
jgi:hypothetical protein